MKVSTVSLGDKLKYIKIEIIRNRYHVNFLVIQVGGGRFSGFSSFKKETIREIEEKDHRNAPTRRHLLQGMTPGVDDRDQMSGGKNSVFTDSEKMRTS